MAKSFSAEEQAIRMLFQVGNSFVYDGQKYTVTACDKPTCGAGEPKTDVYVLTRDDRQGTREFKISFKKRNANFLENKTNPQRAEQLLGSGWADIISQATYRMQNAFLSRPLIYKEGTGKTGAGSITLGWKFELLNVDSGQLSGQIPLTRDQIMDVYAGTNLSPDKRNAYVNGRCVPDSGVANFIIFEDQPIRTLQDAANALIPIEKYVDTHPNVYFACKALNYRTFEGKHDGNRPLAVYVHWSVTDGKLDAALCFDRPLTTGGNEVCEKLRAALRTLGVRTTDDLNADNIADVRIVNGSIGPSAAPHAVRRVVPPTAAPAHPAVSPKAMPKSSTPPASRAKTAVPEISKGTKVYNSKWGVGTVRQVGPGDMIEVEFANYRTSYMRSLAFAQGTLKLKD